MCLVACSAMSTRDEKGKRCTRSTNKEENTKKGKLNDKEGKRKECFRGVFTRLKEIKLKKNFVIFLLHLYDYAHFSFFLK